VKRKKYPGIYSETYSIFHTDRILSCEYDLIIIVLAKGVAARASLSRRNSPCSGCSFDVKVHRATRYRLSPRERSKREPRERVRNEDREAKPRRARTISLKLQRWKVRPVSARRRRYVRRAHAYVPCVFAQSAKRGIATSSCDDLLARLFVHASNVYILVSHRVGQRWTLLRAIKRYQCC